MSSENHLTYHPQTTHNTNDTEGLSEELVLLPRLVKFLLRFYAVISLIGSLLFLIANLTKDGTSSFFKHIEFTWLMITGSPGTVLESWIFFIPILYFLLLAIYYVGLFRLRRWAVAITVFVVIGIVLRFLYRVLVVGNDFVWSTPLSLESFWVVLSIAVVVCSILYRKSLLGPGRKLWLQIPTIIALLPTTLFVGLSVIFVDNKTLNDAHVLPTDQSIVADADNAYLALILKEEMTTVELAALKKVSALHKDLISGEKIVNPSELHSVVTETKRISDAFIGASKLSSIQCPSYVNKMNLPVGGCELNTIRDTALLLYLRMIDGVNQGDYQDAVTASVAIVNFSHHFEQMSTNVSLIEYLVSSVVRKVGYDAIEYILSEIEKLHNQGLIEQSIVDEIKIAIRSALEKTKPDANALVNSWQVEYESLKQASGFPMDVPSNYFWHPNRTLQNFADIIGLRIKHQLQVCGSVEEKLSLQILESTMSKYVEKETIYSYLFKPNAIGEILNSVVIPSESEYKSQYCTIEQRHGLLQETVS